MVETIVTGAAGFLGSHLVDRLLDRGDRVLGIDDLSTGRKGNLQVAQQNARFRFLRANLVRATRIPRAEGYFHLASPASPAAYQRSPVATLRANSEGTLHVLEAARHHDAKVLLASTSEVYGDPEVHPQTESYWGHVNPVGTRSCYDEGKRFAEALGASYRRTYDLDVRIVRIFNTFGPRMSPDDGRVISNFLVQGLRGQPVTLHGKGNQTRSFCYVSDLIEGLLRLMAAPATTPTPMNLGNPREVTIREVARLVAKVLHIPLRVRSLALPEDDPRRRCPDISLARRYLRWEPRIPLEIGLRETATYFRNQLKLPIGARP